MLQQLPTTNVLAIQRALDLHQQGRGPLLVGNFRGKGSIELVAIRQKNNEHLEGQCLLCRKNEWHEVTAIFYQT